MRAERGGTSALIFYSSHFWPRCVGGLILSNCGRDLPLPRPAYPSVGPSRCSSSCRRTRWRWWRARTGSRRACGAAGRPGPSAGSPGTAGCTSPASTPCRDPGEPPWSLPLSSGWPRRCSPGERWTYRKSGTLLLKSLTNKIKADKPAKNRWWTSSPPPSKNCKFTLLPRLISELLWEQKDVISSFWDLSVFTNSTEKRVTRLLSCHLLWDSTEFPDQQKLVCVEEPRSIRRRSKYSFRSERKQLSEQHVNQKPETLNAAVDTTWGTRLHASLLRYDDLLLFLCLNWTELLDKQNKSSGGKLGASVWFTPQLSWAWTCSVGLKRKESKLKFPKDRWRIDKHLLGFKWNCSFGSRSLLLNSTGETTFGAFSL